MSAYKEFEKIIFSFTKEAAELGGQTAVDNVEYGHIFHFEDKDAIKFLQGNAAQLSQSSLDRLKGNLDETVIAGVRDGKPIREITKDVHAIFDDMKGHEAERIARTEVARGTNNGALVGYDSMEVAVVEYYANAGACPECEAHHGDLMTVDEAMNYIPLHPNCYCFWLPRPDITNTKIQGWKSLGEISEEVVKGLGITNPFRRVSMSPETQAKIADKSVGHLQDTERMRLVVEFAESGTIDNQGHINVIRKITTDKWEFTPIKNTDDYGMIALSDHEIKRRQLSQKIRKAVKTYGL